MKKQNLRSAMCAEETMLTNFRRWVLAIYVLVVGTMSWGYYHIQKMNALSYRAAYGIYGPSIGGEELLFVALIALFIFIWAKSFEPAFDELFDLLDEKNESLRQEIEKVEEDGCQEGYICGNPCYVDIIKRMPNGFAKGVRVYKKKERIIDLIRILLG